MHSSRPRSHREKLLIDMDRVRKSFTDYAGREEGVSRASWDENRRLHWETQTEINRDLQMEVQMWR